MNIIKTECTSCHKFFEHNEKIKRKYCSEKCAYIGKIKHPERECLICKILFKPRKSTARYCSEFCRHMAHSDFMKNDENRKLHNIGFKKGQEPWNKNKYTGLVPKSAYKKGEKRRLGKDHHSWKGGKYLHGGYVSIYIPPTENGKKGKHFLEHRLVMEKHIGRKLLSNEIVHHRNGKKDDNRIENLEIVLRNAHKGEVQCPHCLKHFSIR